MTFPQIALFSKYLRALWVFSFKKWRYTLLKYSKVNSVKREMYSCCIYILKIQKNICCISKFYIFNIYISVGTWIELKFNKLWTASNLIGRTLNSLEPRFVHQNQTSQTPSKSPNIKPVRAETGQTQAQIWKNWTSNPSEPRFVYQNWSTNPPKPSKNPKLWTHELGSTQH